MLLPKFEVDLGKLDEELASRMRPYAILSPLVLLVKGLVPEILTEANKYLEDLFLEFDCVVLFEEGFGRVEEEVVIEFIIQLLNNGCNFVTVPASTGNLLESLIDQLPQEAHQRVFSQDTVQSDSIVGGFVTDCNQLNNLDATVFNQVGKTKYKIYNCEVEDVNEETLKATIRTFHRDIQPYKHDSPIHIILSAHLISLEFAAQCFCACLKIDTSDKMQLWPTIVADESNQAIGLVYSSPESIEYAVTSGWATYYSRSRQELWIKGATSGNKQKLMSITFDCDADALKFIVKPDEVNDRFCHQDQFSCFNNFGNFGTLKSSNSINGLYRLINQRKKNAPPKSYTARLFSDVDLLENKVLEEGQELIEAIKLSEGEQRVESELGDLLYFGLVALCMGNGTLTGVVRELDLRHLKVKRRPGNSKQHRIDAAKQKLQK